jgi:redox-sensitive bicupin YhaK (pirin superfamily)
MTEDVGSRKIERVVRGRPTSDGAGVRLTRVIGGEELPELDPFLLFDEFGSDDAADYLAGFPDHPHRGFETVTYMLEGRMRHRDNHGNSGLLSSGGAQWMTAGRGIVHSEMPEQESGRMHGFQLWVNLPARAKMSPPRYQDVEPGTIPEVRLPGARVRVLAGTFGDARGPMEAPATEALYLDVILDARGSFRAPLPIGHAAFVFAYEGRVEVGPASAARALERGDLGVLGRGEVVELRAPAGPVRAVLVAGKPLGEPIARYGPFVMNTQDEIAQALRDLRAGRF